VVDGTKRYVRHVHFYTPSETVEARMVYDYSPATGRSYLMPRRRIETDSVFQLDEYEKNRYVQF
jgi:hypothetical protein